MAGGNYDFRPSSVADREFFAVDKEPVFYAENVNGLVLSHGKFHLDGPITVPYIKDGYLLKNVKGFRNDL